MTLALLITAATGAWADSFSTEAYTADATLSAVSVTGDQTLTINEGVTVTVNNGLTINSGATLTVTGGGSLAVNGATGANGPNSYTPGAAGSTAIGGSGQLAIANATITATGGAGGNGYFDEYSSFDGGNGAPAVSGVSISIQTGSLTAIGGAGGIGGTSTVYNQKYPDGSTANAFNSFPNISDATLSYSTDNVTYTKYESGNTTLYRYMKVEPPTGPAVTIADGNGEASFKMPQYDVTANYTIKRDMTVDMDVTVQDAQQNSRFRVQNQGNSFVPVGLTNEQVMALFKVRDDIEEKDLTAITDYTVQIFAADDNDQPTGTAMTFSNFTYAPGKYVVKAVAAEGSNYSGETALSNVFTLFQGYEVTVPAGEYITYYKDEALYVEDTEAKLYTITAVNGDKATATELTVAAASTPLLVKNNAETEKTILLIPTTNEADNVTAATEFKGTLDAAQIAASTSTQNNYAFNGKEFVWVKNAIDIAANKAWLEVNTPSNARSVSIVFGDTTGINEALRVKSEESADGDWYDLDGRKLQAAPKRKGVYIHNGRKEVVK